jgi:ribosome-binding protein aMBF1 (putative translation factor)
MKALLSNRRFNIDEYQREYKWENLKNQALKNVEVQEGYDKARRSYELAEKVRKIREKIGLSQRELAQRMGTTQPSIARLEAGGNPNVGTLVKNS